MHWAAVSGYGEAISALCLAGYDISRHDPERKFAPIHHATFYGKVHAILALKEAEADISARDASNRTSLHYAVLGGQVEALVLLKELGADILARDSQGHTPLDLAELSQCDPR